MAIDDIMLRSVRYFLMGRVVRADLIHQEIKATGRSFDYVFSKNSTLGDSIDCAKIDFISDCNRMLEDPVPVPYSHTENYSLRPEDREFLNDLLKQSSVLNWRISEELNILKSRIDEYAPHKGI